MSNTSAIVGALFLVGFCGYLLYLDYRMQRLLERLDAIERKRKETQ